MAKKKKILNKTNSSGWLDDYSEESVINEYQQGGRVNLPKSIPNDPLLSPGQYQQLKTMLGSDKKALNYINENLTPSATIKKGKERKAKELSEKERKLLEKEQRIALSAKRQEVPFFSKERWTPESIAEETGAIGDKYSLQNIPFAGEYIPDILDVTGGIGSMASGLGRLPLNVREGNYGQVALDLAGPLTTGALAGIGTQNVGQFANNLVNPLAGAGDLISFNNKNINNLGFKNYSNVSNKLNNTLNNINYELSTVVKKLNPFYQKKAKQELINANKWQDDWYNDPKTIERINTLSDYAENNKIYKDGLPINWDKILDRINNKNYLAEFQTRNSKLKKILKGEERVHKGNYGVSGYNLDNTFKGNRQNFVDKYSPKVELTAIHEGNHGLTDGNELLSYNDQLNIVKIFGDDAEIPRRNSARQFNSYNEYLQDPTEVYARIMEIRNHMGLKPGEILENDKFFNIMDRGRAGEMPVESRFFNLIKNPPEFKNLFNRLPTAALPIGLAGAASQIEEKQDGGIIDTIKEFFTETTNKPAPKPAPAKSSPKTFKIEDKRKVLATSGQPLRPNSDLTSGEYDLDVLKGIIESAKRKKLPIEDVKNLAAIAFQETKFGKTDGNIGHVFEDLTSRSDLEAFTNAYITKMKEADRLGIKDEAKRLQVYNGLKLVTPDTEKDYHGFKMKKIYGVPVPKEGINMKKNPLYGKQIMDLRDNVLNQNPEYVNYLNTVYNSKDPVPVYSDIELKSWGTPPLLRKFADGGKVNDDNGYLISNLDNFTPKKVINSNYITTNNMAFPVEANGVILYPNTGDYIFPTNKVTEIPIMKDGGSIYNDMKKKLKKYQAGGYLDYQDAYKGFGVGPNLTQDNSYYRSIMPTKIENIEGDINKPSVFSGINDVLGKVNQGVNQAVGLMSQFNNMSQPNSQIMPDISQWQSPMSGRKTDEQLNFENDQALKSAGLFNYYYPPQNTQKSTGFMGNTPTVETAPSSFGSYNWNIKSPLYSAPVQKNGGYLRKYQDGGMMDMPVGYPEYIHKSNVFQPHEIPVPRVHFSDDTSVFDMGVNLNDLVQMNGGGIGKYQYGGFMNQPRVFNSNSQRANAAQLDAARQGDFMHTKLRNDRQQFADNKVDWGFMDWAKEPVGAALGLASGVPIVGDLTQDIVGDSFLTRTGGYQVGKGAGSVTRGAAKIVGGIATVNPAMIGSGVGDVGSGVGGAVGNLNAKSAMGDYNKQGYVSGKRLEKSAQDFGNMMNTASSLYGNMSGGLDMAKNMGGMSGMMNKLKGGKQGMQGFGNIMQMFSGMGGQGGGFDFSQLAGMMGQNGGYVDNYQEGGMVYMPEDLEIPKFKKGGLTPTKARKMLHDKSFTTDKQRKYFGYISSQKKANGGWLESL